MSPQQTVRHNKNANQIVYASKEKLLIYHIYQHHKRFILWWAMRLLSNNTQNLGSGKRSPSGISWIT